MDIFNIKRVRELESDLVSARLERDNLRNELNYTMQKYRALQFEVLNTPKDCKLGGYCKACAFAKVFYADPIHSPFDAVYVCGKGASCKNFIQKGSTN